jgi:signal transduction histidine kinase
MQEVENIYEDAYHRTKCLKGLFTHDISNLFQVLSNSIELCETLLRDGVKIEDIIEYFQLIAQQLNRGKKLIRNIRNLSEIEELEMPLKPIDVLHYVKDAIEFANLIFPEKMLNIEVISDYENSQVIANELLLDVFENLIMNSIIYNDNEVIKIRIIISDIQYQDYLTIEFQDNGIGIKDEQKKTIFQRKVTKNKLSKGLGIGLSLVAELIKLYNGKIWIEDRVKGNFTKGSNFIMLIPITKKMRLIYND